MTLMEWIQRGTGAYRIDQDLYVEALVNGGMVIRRPTRQHVEILTASIRWELAQLEDDATARLALIEMYDDADPPVHDFAARLDMELCSPCPCGSGASSLLCKCDGGVME